MAHGIRAIVIQISLRRPTAIEIHERIHHRIVGDRNHEKDQ